MYIHKTYSINNQYKDIKEYKLSLKDLYTLNLRRSSKFNALALLGALNCMKNIVLDKKTGVYICSEYGAITSVKKVLDEISKGAMIMPFDFLNINSNNVSFYVSQALKISGKNMLLTSENLSFESGLDMALFDLEIDEVEEVLLGKVDESLNEISNYNQYISNINNLPSNDYSGWLYINKIKENALCEIKFIKSFSMIDQLNSIIKTSKYEVVCLNQFASASLDKIEIEKSKVFEYEFLNSMEYITKFINEIDGTMILISMNFESKGYVISLKK